jgi:hypothetical protein
MNKATGVMRRVSPRTLPAPMPRRARRAAARLLDLPIMCPATCAESSVCREDEQCRSRLKVRSEELSEQLGPSLSTCVNVPAGSEDQDEQLPTQAPEAPPEVR